MRNARVVALLVTGLLLGACAEAGPRAEPGRPSPTPTLPGGSATGRYQADTTVLQAPGEPAMLCLGGIATSLPPQCGDVPVPNWDWDAVEGEERMSGVVWGQYHVVGTYDGETFTLEETGPYVQPAFDEDPIGTPCPEPDGGWTSPDPEKASEQTIERIGPSLREEPDFGGLWIDYIEDPVSESFAEPGNVILNAAFTGDLDRHESEIREDWGGPLCLVEHERPYSELLRIQSELGEDRGASFGLLLLSSSPSEVHNWIDVQVVLADSADQEALDARYGAGVVRLTSALRPAG